MTQDMVMDIFTAAVMLAFRLILPVLLLAMLVGLTIAILQAATQVNEQTLTFAPKAITIALALLIMGPWMTNAIVDFMTYIFDIMANTPLR
jgi:flagellar biosynthetic protein FliQ